MVALASPALVSAAPAKAAEPSAAKLKRVQTLLSLSGAGKMSRRIAVQMIARIRSAFPKGKVPEAFWRRMVVQADVKGLLAQVAQVYAKELTMADVEALITFYESPVGRRFVTLQPKLSRATLMLGHTWGRALARRVGDELKAKGYIGKGKAKRRGGQGAKGKTAGKARGKAPRR